MNRIKLGFLGVALFGAITAFATKQSSNELPCDQENINSKCEQVTNMECCVAQESLIFNGVEYNEGETVQGQRLD